MSYQEHLQTWKANEWEAFELFVLIGFAVILGIIIASELKQYLKRRDAERQGGI